MTKKPLHDKLLLNSVKMLEQYKKQLSLTREMLAAYECRITTMEEFIRANITGDEQGFKILGPMVGKGTGTKRPFYNNGLRDEVTQLQKQLAALAEQNAKMREDLSRWRYQNLSYNWCCGNCGVVEGDEHKEGCALSLPNLATPPVSEDRKDAERFREGWTHACNALCMEIALWIERCPHCGMTCSGPHRRGQPFVIRSTT